MSDIKLQTPKFDARFPNVNQTKNCWQNFVDYHKCRKAKGEDYYPCEYFKKTYKSLCPVSWVSYACTCTCWINLNIIVLS